MITHFKGLTRMSKLLLIISFLFIMVSHCYGFGFVCNSRSNNSGCVTITNLADAATNPALVNKTAVVASPLTISSDLTWPSDRALVVQKGGLITVPSGVTLTINGSYQCGLYQGFAGDGSVVFNSGSVTEVYAEWFGALCDLTSDDAPAVTKAAYSYKVLKLLDRTYTFLTPVVLENKNNVADYVGWKIRGANPLSTKIINKVSAGRAAIELNGSNGITESAYWFMYDGEISDLQIIGDGSTANHGISTIGLWAWTFKNVILTNQGGNAYLSSYNASYNPDYSATVLPLFENCIFSGSNYGVYLVGANAMENATFKNCKMENNKHSGFYGVSTHLQFEGGSISFNGTSYSGDYSPDVTYGGISVPVNAYSPKGVNIRGLEMDNNVPQHIFIAQAKAPIIESCLFADRLHSGSINKYSVVLGADANANNTYCENAIVQGNNFTIPTSLVGLGISHTCVLSDKFATGGKMGENSYSIAGATVGTELFYLEDIEADSPRNTVLYAMKYATQNGQYSSSGFKVPYTYGINSVAIADDGVISFKPPIDRGFIAITGNGARTTSAIFAFTVSSGKVYRVAYDTGATPVIEGMTSSTQLTGTTGTDGKITLACYTTDGKIYVENRFGGSLNFTISLLSGIGDLLP